MKKKEIILNNIEIDDEVMDFLKENADPFIDTPNTALRKIFNLDRNIKNPNIEIPKLPIFIPKALIQILEVFYLVLAEDYSRNKATNFIANKYSIYPQTVMDKYCRQLNMTSNELDKLLDNSDLGNLKIKIKNKFGKYAVDVDQYFKHIQKKSIHKSWREVSV